MFLNSLLLAYQDIVFDRNAPDPVAAGGGIMSFLCGGVGLFICFGLFLAIMIIPMIGLWKMFEKAGRPGWAAIVPFYNYFILTEIAGMDIMWFILLLVPCVNIYAAFMIMINVAQNFGKDTMYGVLMALFPYIFIPMLGFSDAKYTPMKH
jgi:hypothetical protein